MNRVPQSGRLVLAAWALVALGTLPSPAQNRRSSEPRSAPRPPQVQRAAPRPAPERARPERPQPSQPPRPYEPPKEGHHSGQWLNRHREQSLDQQRQALEKDPQFRRLPPERQQRLEQRLERFNSLPPDRQQQVLERMEKWEHLTAQQKEQFRSVDSQFKSLPLERQQAVRNAIQTLRAMPPEARQRAIESGRFSHFSPEEQHLLNDASRLPLAPAPADQPEEAPATDRQHYVPRPPH